VASPNLAIHSPLQLFATYSEAPGEFSPPVKSCPAHRILIHPPKSENHRAICQNSKMQTFAPESAPTDGSQGKANHTPIAKPWQQKPSPPGILRETPQFLAVRLPNTLCCANRKSRSFRRAALVQWPVKGLLNWLPHGSETSSLECTCCGCISLLGRVSPYSNPAMLQKGKLGFESERQYWSHPL
jgi:hypothetical protein